MSTLFAPAFLNALGGSPLELAVVFVAVLVLFGAKSLPGTLRTLGKWSEQLRRISREFQQEISDAGDPFREVQEEWKDTTDSLRVTQDHDRFSPRPDPLEDTEDLQKHGDDFGEDYHDDYDEEYLEGHVEEHLEDPMDDSVEDAHTDSEDTSLEK